MNYEAKRTKESLSPTSSLVLRCLIFGLCSFGFLYYAYKYYQPQFGGSNYYEYYKVYLKPLHNDAMEPFRFRKISGFITFLLYKSGLYYPNEIAFAQPEFSQRVFFAALFSNYLALLGTALVCSYIGTEKGASPLVSGFLVFFSFGAQAFVITGLTEGWAWFLVALGFWCYTRRQFGGLWLVLLLSAFQRETIIVLFGVFAAMDALQAKNEWTRRYQQTLAMSVVAFMVYLLLRHFDPMPSLYQNQLHPSSLWENLRHFKPHLDFMMQAFLSQNLLFLLLVGVVVLRLNGIERPPYIRHILFATVVLMFGGIAVGISNNVGRILAVMTPILAPTISIALSRLKL